MNDAILAFNRELYLEHFEEISFLYKNREAHLHGDELQWHELQDDEERIEAHLDALVVGGQLAIKAMLEICNEGDPGAFYVAACLFCRHSDLSGLFKFFAALDSESAEILNAVRDALIQDWPDKWFASLENYPFHDYPFLISIFMPLYANRRSAMDQRLFQIPVSKKLFDHSLFLKSVRRLGGITALPNNHWYLSDAETQEALQEKALCLLRLSNPNRVLDFFQKRLPEQQIPFAAIVTAADEQLTRFICQPTEKPSVSRLIAMGLAGLRDFIVPLLEYLKDEKMAPVAAVALQTITGAGLMGGRFVEDEWDEDELFADELKAFREGKPPRHPGGDPYGTREQALSTDPEVWRQWLREHAKDFQPGIRYRLGLPVSPGSLVRALSHPMSTRLVRSLSYEELVLRYGATIAFNPEDWVSKQKRAISALGQWAKSVEHNVQPGGWDVCGYSTHSAATPASPQGAY